MKNNALTILLVSIIGILSGVSLIYGIGNSVSVAVGPLAAGMGEIAAIQKQIHKQVGLNSQNDELSRQLASIHRRLSEIESKLGNDVQARAAAPQKPQVQQPPQEDMNKVHSIPVGATPILGKKDAPVTIVEFSDLQCPFCSRFHKPVLEVLKAYPSQVNLMIKNYPLDFHKNARPAAKLALAANIQGKYFEMVDELLTNGADVTEDKIKEYAKKIGLKYNQLMADYKNKDAQWEQIINDDITLGNQSGVRGTPTFFINGKNTNARDLNAFKLEIDKILADKK